MPETTSHDIPVKAGALREPVITHFSTARHPTASRTDAWREFAEVQLILTNCTAYSDDGAIVNLRHVRRGSVIVSEGTQNEMLMERSPLAIAKHRSESVMVIVVLSGSAFHYHRSGSIVLSPGDALLVDADMPGAQGYSAHSRILVVSVDREMFLERTGQNSFEAPRVMRSFVSESGSTPDERRVVRMRSALRGAAVEGVEEDALALVESAFDFGTTGRSPYFLSAREFIRSNLHDPGLSVNRIARELSISERQLARAFATSGTTVAATITDMRLNRARRLLIDPEWGSESIGAIGAAVGFTSPSSFAHVFRRRFGLSPRDDRSAQTVRTPSSID